MKVRLANGPRNGETIEIPRLVASFVVPVKLRSFPLVIREADLLDAKPGFTTAVYELRRGSIQQNPPVYYHAGTP